jgi:hypothetical protein
MINLGKQSKLDPSLVIRHAVAFFGEGGLGLAVLERTESTVQFEGGGGSVAIAANAKNGGSDVTIQSQEWDFQAQQFVERI